MTINERPRIELPPEGSLGPAMLALPTDKQRLFVIAMLELGDFNATRAAAMAGYDTSNANSLKVSAHRLAHDEKILAAISEEAGKRLHSGGILAVSQLLYLAKNAEKDSDKIKAANSILNRIGMHEKNETKHTVVDESRTDREVLARIAYLSKELGVDQTKLLGFTKMPVVDAEFAEVSPTDTPERINADHTPERMEDGDTDSFLDD